MPTSLAVAKRPAGFLLGAIPAKATKMSSSRKKRRTKKTTSKNHTTIEQHHRQGKTLIPPLKRIPNVKKTSWRNQRLPEMLWATILVSNLPRQRALSKFREIADYLSQFRDTDSAPFDITHTGLAKLAPEVTEEIINILVSTDDCKQILSSLLLLEDLPAEDSWKLALGKLPKNTSWQPLMRAVAYTLDHQSQESTDCRWACVICMLAAGKLVLPSEEVGKEFIYYPEYGDMRKVRPSIRATEGALSLFETDTKWPAKFWEQCLTKTPCFPLKTRREDKVIIGTTIDQVTLVNDLLVNHCNNTRATSAIDPRHDTVFGVALYCLNLLKDLLHVAMSQSITARLALRTIVECFVTLNYLAKRDDPELWQSYRIFGAGQAKLTYLKLDELNDQPSYVQVETLKELANEDMWEEFLPIELGHWEKTNLRKISEDGGVKDQYDRFYSWTSTFSHGHWGAIRDSVYDICGNPLHRLHRIPRSSARALPDVIPDACILADKILETVSHCYPDFPSRVTIQNWTSEA